MSKRKLNSHVVKDEAHRKVEVDPTQPEAIQMEACASQEDQVIKHKKDDVSTTECKTHLKQELENTEKTKNIQNGSVTSDVMSNGNGLADGFCAVGDTLINGSLPPTAPPQSTSSPNNSQTQDPSPGVAARPPTMIEQSEGASAEVTFHKGDALQSLKLSMPMQETELSNQKPSLEMENEEKIRLEARRRLEEQLKQYRVQRHKEREVDL